MTVPYKQTDRAFGLMFACVLSIFAGLLWLIFDITVVWLVVAAGIFLGLALVVPGALLPLNRAWAAFGHRLGKINNFILLGLFFYLLILPISMVFKLVGRDSMQRSIEPDAKTYWRQLERRAAKDNYPDMF